MMRRSFVSTSIGVLAFVVIACSPAPSIGPTGLPGPSAPPTAEPSVVASPEPSTVSFALRTFPWAAVVDGTPIGCDAIGVADPVFGHLSGTLPVEAPEAIWLETPDGSRLSIVWPEGFTLEFEPTPVVYDQTGVVVARLGDAVMLQVPRAAAAGTHDDPYFASGILLAGAFTPSDISAGVQYQGCFPRIADVGVASWWVDPASGALSAETTVVPALLIERACASGQSPDGRVLEPVIEYGVDAVVVTISVTRRVGGQDCPGNPEFPLTITLREPLGERALLDGGSTPPRDATTTP